MPILFEDYTLVKTWDPGRRTPVIPAYDEHSGVVEVGRKTGLVQRLQAVSGETFWIFVAGMFTGVFIVPMIFKKS